MKRLLSIALLLIICGMLFAADNKFVVVIDPGHGGRDGGAVRGTYKEKEINLGVALALGELIEKNMKDVKVVYTRKADAFVALDRRAEIANKAKANLFISIHTNSTAARKTSASGADTYILGLSRTEENLAVAKRENSVILLEDDYTTKYEGFDPNSPESYIIFEFMTNKYRDQSLDLAGFVQRDFRGVAKRADRGVREAGFLVLRKTSMPSVLIELGFINNDSEAKFLSTKSGQRIMATAIYSGFKDYKKNFDKMQGKSDVNTSKTIVRTQNTKPTVQPAIQETKRTTDKDVAVSGNNKQSNITPKTDKASPTPSTVVKTKEEQIPSPLKEEPKVIDLRTDITEYRVQFLYSDYKLPVNSPEFKGLSPIEYYVDKGYKYTYGLTGDMNEIEKIQTEVRKKFKDAFVIKQDKETNSNRRFYQLEESQRTTYNIIRTQKEPQDKTTKTKSSKAKENPVPSKVKKDEIEYRVQFLISSHKLPDNSGAFKGLSPVSFYIENGYKYTYGSTASMVEIQRIQAEVRKKFKDAFVVKFKNGERIK